MSTEVADPGMQRPDHYLLPVPQGVLEGLRPAATESLRSGAAAGSHCRGTDTQTSGVQGPSKGSALPKRATLMGIHYSSAVDS